MRRRAALRRLAATDYSIHWRERVRKPRKPLRSASRIGIKINGRPYSMRVAMGRSGALVGQCETDGTLFTMNYRLKLKDPDNIRASVNKPVLRKMLKVMDEHDERRHQNKRGR